MFQEFPPQFLLSKNKFPINPKTMGPYKKGSDWQKNKIGLVDFATAEKLQSSNHRVAFLLTESDPYFVVDLDNCVVNGDWSDTAKDIISMLPGSAVEVSQSGVGLHIWGKSSNIPPHRQRTKDGLELYSSGHVMTLGNYKSISGACTTDITTSLRSVINKYFPPLSLVSNTVQLRDKPVDGYSSTETDDEIIARALKSTSVAAMFGGTSCAFNDLWDANLSVLSVKYPSASGEAYDASACDAALAQHLMFWCGGNGERVKRLMLKSSLVREKWNRDDYLPNTVLKAQNLQTDYYSVVEAGEESWPKLRGTEASVAYANKIRSEKLSTATGPIVTDALKVTAAKTWLANKDKPLESVIAATTKISDVPDLPPSRFTVQVKTGYQFLTSELQLKLWQGSCYVLETNTIFTPEYGCLERNSFNSVYGGYVFQIDDTGDSTTKEAWTAYLSSQCLSWPKIERAAFLPRVAYGHMCDHDHMTVVNTYKPVPVERTPGDPSKFFDLFNKLLPDERDRQIMWSYMAACVQHQGCKFQWCPIIQGGEGNGKTTLSRVVEAAIGRQYCHRPQTHTIGEKFNDWLFEKTFISIEDIYVPESNRELPEIMKPMITGEWQSCRGMQKSQRMKEVCANFIMNCNWRNIALKSRGDRRYCVFFSAQQQPEDLIRDGITAEYLSNLYTWLREGGYAILTHELWSYQIPAEFNPALEVGGLAHRAPVTSTTEEAIAESQGSVEQEIAEIIAEGRPGFNGGWISSAVLDEVLTQIRKSTQVPRKARRKLLADLGYVPHPGLKDGRCTRPTNVDFKKPILYIQRDHKDIGITSPGEVINAYEAAQRAV